MTVSHRARAAAATLSAWRRWVASTLVRGSPRAAKERRGAACSGAQEDGEAALLGSLDALGERADSAVDALMARSRSEVEVSATSSFGEVPARPLVSWVVHLDRADLLEHQLAQHADAPGHRELEAIFVADGPGREELACAAAQLYETYRLPFRLVLLGRPAGRALAKHLGTTLARGPMLLLQDASVFPESSGWVQRLLRFHAAQPGVGAVAPLVLDEQGAISHAGYVFERTGETWTARRRLRGARLDGGSAVSTPVLGASDACLLVSREHYREAGGLRGGFLLGEGDDAELGLRLARLGHPAWCDSQLAMRQIESGRPSRPDRERAWRYAASRLGRDWSRFLDERGEQG